jgi:hypothetical protein
LAEAAEGIRRMEFGGTPRRGNERTITGTNLMMYRFAPEFMADPSLGGDLAEERRRPSVPDRVERRAAETRLRDRGFPVSLTPATADDVLTARFFGPDPEPSLAATLFENRRVAEQPEIAAALRRPSFVVAHRPRAAAPAEGPATGVDVFAAARRRTGTAGRAEILSPRAPLIGGVATIDPSLLPPGATFVPDPRALGLGLLYDEVVTTDGTPASEYISLPITMFMGEETARRMRGRISPDGLQVENATDEEAEEILRNVRKMAESIGECVTPENAREAAYQVANFIVPGGLEHINAYRRGEISGAEFLVREARGVALDAAFIALGGPVGKAVCKVGGKIVRRSVCGITAAAERATETSAARFAAAATERTVALSAERAAAERYAAEAIREAPTITAREIGWTGRTKFWKTGANPRGYKAEDYICKTMPTGTQKLPYGFRIFDLKQAAEGGVKAISVKTLDTMTPARIANPRQIFYTVNKHVRDMLNFVKPQRHYSDIMKRSDIVSRELQLVIPANTSTVAIREITNAIEKAVFENDNLFVKIIKVAD